MILVSGPALKTPHGGVVTRGRAGWLGPAGPRAWHCPGLRARLKGAALRFTTLRVCLRQPLTPTTATLGLAAIEPAEQLGGQRPSGLFPIGLAVPQAMIKLADQLVRHPAERLLVAVAEPASLLVERPGARGGVDRTERPVPAGVEQPGIADPAHQHHSALPGRLGDG